MPRLPLLRVEPRGRFSSVAFGTQKKSAGPVGLWVHPGKGPGVRALPYSPRQAKRANG
jgi:hypothetical protein